VPDAAIPRMLVAGIGNIFWGDDGFGPEVVRRLAERGGVPANVRVVDYGIRGMHLAYDLLDGVDVLVLVDALPGLTGEGAGAPPGVVVLHIGQDDLGRAEFDAHGMSPVAVLGSLEMLGGSLPPTYLVGCCPGNLDEGIGLSEPVAAAVDDAVDVTMRLLDELLASGLARR
jgi:hydrogenase maturation protease